LPESEPDRHGFKAEVEVLNELEATMEQNEEVAD
jgi:hypothetical protein